MKELISFYGSQKSTQPVLFIIHNIGLSTYELTNHLGNVLSVISDKPIPHQNGQTVDYWQAEVRQATDYSPFGAQLQTRNLFLTVLGNVPYRYSFQGQEHDDEIKGKGNSVNYTYRMHDPRLGRFFARDPLANEYPHYSPYSFSGNILIHNVELEGLENIHYLEKKVDGTWGAVQINGKDWIDVISELDENVNCYLYGWPNGSGVMKSVYKSHQQGGKDRWEHWGGTAPYDLLRAHYDHDHSQATNAVEMSRAAAGPTPWYRKGLLGDWSGGHDGANLGGWGGSKEKELKYGLTAISAIVAIGTGGMSLILQGGVSGVSGYLTVGGMINAADDVSGLLTADGKTFIQKAIGEKAGTTVKLIGGFTTSKASLIDAVNNLDDATRASLNIISAVNDQGTTYYGLVQLSNDTSDEK